MEQEFEIVDELWFCGANPTGHARKRAWFEQNVPLGLRSKKLKVKATGEWIGAIEYMPGEFTWRAIDAKNYMVIHCINVIKKHAGQGYGSYLIQACIQDAKAHRMDGVAALTTRKSWCADSRIYLKNGFEIVDRAPPAFELLANRFRDAPLPSFSDWKECLEAYQLGVFMFYSSQCPFMREEHGHTRRAWLRSEYGLEGKVITIDNYQAAQANPCVWGTYGIVCNGEVVSHVPGGDGFLRKQLRRLKQIP